MPISVAQPVTEARNEPTTLAIGGIYVGSQRLDRRIDEVGLFKSEQVRQDRDRWMIRTVSRSRRRAEF